MVSSSDYYIERSWERGGQCVPRREGCEAMKRATYCWARRMASGNGAPRASWATMAEERTQPVPCFDPLLRGTEKTVGDPSGV